MTALARAVRAARRCDGGRKCGTLRLAPEARIPRVFTWNHHAKHQALFGQEQ